MEFDMKQSGKIAFCGVTVAVEVIFLYLAALMKLNTIALMVVVSCMSIMVVLQCGKPSAAVAFVATAILAFFLVPDKSLAVMYTAFFGWYGIIKSLAERQKSRIVEWAVKVASENAAFFAAWYILMTMLQLPAGKLPLAVIWALGQVGFVVYDLFLSYAIGFYQRKVKKGNR